MLFNDMHECFNSMKDKVNLALDETDLKSIYETLESINEPTILTGVGGSSIVATFFAKVLREKKGIIATFVLPRDIQYMNLDGYKNIIIISYSGNNAGVEACLNNNLNKYLFTGHPRNDVTNLVYKMPEEESYVSINATIVPMAIILMYYKHDRELINDILATEFKTTSNSMHYEVMYGYENIASATMLESSFTESGMASCILHEKYNYAHGRINIINHNDADLIYFDGNNQFDDVLKQILPKLYRHIITIDAKYDDIVINDFYQCQLCLKMIGAIADNKQTSISQIIQFPENNILYLYKGKFK